jgi:PIN domain nuclease of toxin-antitoxin system
MECRKVSLILLDTHILVWLMQGVERISEKKRDIIRGAGKSGNLRIAAITPWEVAMLVSRSRLVLPMDVGEWITAAVKQFGISVIPLSPAIAIASNRLPGDFHSDPADQMIVASTRHLNALLITEDRLILSYAEQGHVRATSSK